MDLHLLRAMGLGKQHEGKFKDPLNMINFTRNCIKR